MPPRAAGAARCTTANAGASSGITGAVPTSRVAAVSSVTAASSNSLVLQERIARENQGRAWSAPDAAPFARAPGATRSSSATTARKATPLVVSITGSAAAPPLPADCTGPADCFVPVKNAIRERERAGQVANRPTLRVGPRAAGAAGGPSPARARCAKGPSLADGRRCRGTAPM